jgi:hypothetical protein
VRAYYRICVPINTPKKSVDDLGIFSRGRGVPGEREGERGVSMIEASTGTTPPVHTYAPCGSVPLLWGKVGDNPNDMKSWTLVCTFEPW